MLFGIGASLPAPLFNLVAQPNDWQKQVRSVTQSRGTSARAAIYRTFWEKYLDRLRDEHPDWSSAKTPSHLSWMGFTSPIKGTRINPSFAERQRLRHEIYIDIGDKEHNDALFKNLLRQKDVFEAEYGRPLEWEALPNAKACRIAEYRDEADVSFEDRHDEFVTWFFDAGIRLRRALSAVDTDFD